jgi:hypothetical protein
MTFESLECWWCLYLKSVSTFTTRRKLMFQYGKNSSPVAIKELVMCEDCDNENPISVVDQIKLIVSNKPELQDWLTINPLYLAEK